MVDEKQALKEYQNNLDWKDIELKVEIISRRFRNIDQKYREDLEQELRIFAFTTSCDYYNMYRKAIDYWRHLSRKVYPEVCVFEIDDVNGVEDSYDNQEEYEQLVARIKRELEEYVDSKSKWEKRTSQNAKLIFDLIIADLEDRVNEDGLKQTNVVRYFGGQLAFAWISEQLEIPYAHVQDAVYMIKEILWTLHSYGKLEIPEKCLPKPKKG